MSPAQFHQWLANEARPPLVMGVLNVTPDSFSDGGRFADPAVAVDHALAMLNAGASILDIGGESTRPGAPRVDPAEQIRRVEPVIKAVVSQTDCVISIDTTRSQVAQAALDAGATLINDISAANDDPAILPLAARHQAPIVLMHMQGQPATMQNAPSYRNVVEEIKTFLAAKVQSAIHAGIAPQNILLDPGIGFGKTMSHNLELLRRLAEFTSLGQPLVLGTSRKGFIGKIAGESEPSRRLFGTAASVAWCVANQASIVRVHDVEPMARVVKMIHAIKTGNVD